jgi:2-methylcitrate dehydratase PrpD
VLVDGHAFPSQFTDEKVNDPKIIALRDIIDVSEDPALPRRAAALTMTLKDGTSHSVTTEHALGTPGNPLSDEQLGEKFRVLAGEALPDGTVTSLAERLWALEGVGSVDELTGLLSA